MRPQEGEKRWVKRKGCKNCAKQWVVRYIDDEGIEHGEWVIVPMVVGKDFSYVSKKVNPMGERHHLRNIYFDPKTGVIKRNE